MREQSMYREREQSTAPHWHAALLTHLRLSTLLTRQNNYAGQGNGPRKNYHTLTGNGIT
jgi:hypothetical protein